MLQFEVWERICEVVLRSLFCGAKMMNFVFRTRNCVSRNEKTRSFVFKMMNSAVVEKMGHHPNCFELFGYENPAF